MTHHAYSSHSIILLLFFLIKLHLQLSPFFLGLVVRTWWTTWSHHPMATRTHRSHWTHPSRTPWSHHSVSRAHHHWSRSSWIKIRPHHTSSRSSWPRSHWPTGPHWPSRSHHSTSRPRSHHSATWTRWSR